MGHNPIECEWVGSISLGIGDGMADGVVVLGGFHAAISISGLGWRFKVTGADQSWYGMRLPYLSHVGARWTAISAPLYEAK